jgi:hypothetical protein
MGSPARKIRDRNPNIIKSMEKEIYENHNISPSNFDYVKP